MQSIEPGTPETSKPTGARSASAETGEILPASSGLSSPSSDEVNSRSMNLIDDSVRHLHGLLKSVAVPQGGEGMNVRLDPQKINAACNCAKNIHNLLRLQLDVMKEVRKGGSDS